MRNTLPRLGLDQPQDDVAVALAGAAEGREAVGDVRLDPDQPLALDTRSWRRLSEKGEGIANPGRPP
jgi:hypothetical protein